MNYYPKFAQLLDSYLSNFDRSGAWLAQRLEVNPATITRWRNGDSRPNRPETIIQLADVLGIHGDERQALLHAAGYGYLEEVGSPIDNLSESDKISSDVSDLIFRKDAISNELQSESLNEFKQLLHDRSRIFGETLASILGSRNIPQQRLAAWLGVSPSAVSQWRTGTRIPDAATLYNIGSELGLEVSEIGSLLAAWTVTRATTDLLNYLIIDGNIVNLKVIKTILQNLEIERLMKLTSSKLIS